MSKAAKNILTLNHDEAMDFFMKSEQYHGFELPEYFSFDEVLKYVREKVSDNIGDLVPPVAVFWYR